MTSTTEPAAAPTAPAAPRWGLPAPEGVAASWGARAILYGPARGQCPTLDIVPDRQSFTGPEAECRALSTWLRKCGLDVLRTLVAEEYLTGSEDREDRVEVDGHVIVANPRKSYGYLYVAAWRAHGASPEPAPANVRAVRAKRTR